MWREWKPYVSVAKRRADAKKRAEKMAKKGTPLEPIEISGRKIAATFWGKAWCDNLESYSDYANRLPRGRTYVRNGSVIDLKIAAGQIKALVSGSDIYNVTVDIAPVAIKDWKTILSDCSRSVDSLMDLLQGRFSKGVMERLTRQREGLFPQPREINVRCSCPDYATMCKHVAAVLYGIGARLDIDPQLLFLLRKVDHQELIREAVDGANLDAALEGDQSSTLAGADLGAMFGIDLAATDTTAEPAASGVNRSGKPTRKRRTRATETSASPAEAKAAAPRKRVSRASADTSRRAAKKPSREPRDVQQSAKKRKSARKPKRSLTE
ncbi:MAG: SWIM zinc finger family protein [Planctomycetaceae bacterium]|nr:SWIM zinc finger family protein [Planctomycetaceae bacterium]